MGLTEQGVVHFRNDHIHRVLKGVVHRHTGEEVTGHPQLPVILFLGIAPGKIHQLRKVLFHRPQLELIIVPHQWRIIGMGIAAIQHILLIIKRIQVDALVKLRVQGPRRFSSLQIGPELLSAILAEASACAHGGDRQFRLVQLNALYPCVDLNGHYFFQVIPPHRIVPAGLVAGAAYSLEGVYRFFHLKAEPPLTRYTYYLLRYSQTLDIQKAQTELGYYPKMTIEEGIDNYVQHDQAH